MLLVLNEWVFHDLLGENEAERFCETMRFLYRFRQSDDTLVRPTKARWNQKAYSLMEISHPAGKRVSKLFHSLLRDADKTVIQPEDAEPIPDYISNIPKEDVYLVLAYRSAGANLLVTTDAGLFDALSPIDAVKCCMRDKFLSAYAAGTG